MAHSPCGHGKKKKKKSQVAIATGVCSSDYCRMAGRDEEEKPLVSPEKQRRQQSHAAMWKPLGGWIHGDWARGGRLGWLERKLGAVDACWVTWFVRSPWSSGGERGRERETRGRGCRNFLSSSPPFTWAVAHLHLQAVTGCYAPASGVGLSLLVVLGKPS